MTFCPPDQPVIPIFDWSGNGTADDTGQPLDDGTGRVLYSFPGVYFKNSETVSVEPFNPDSEHEPGSHADNPWVLSAAGEFDAAVQLGAIEPSPDANDSLYVLALNSDDDVDWVPFPRNIIVDWDSRSTSGPAAPPVDATGWLASDVASLADPTPTTSITHRYIKDRGWVGFPECTGGTGSGGLSSGDFATLPRLTKDDDETLDWPRWGIGVHFGQLVRYEANTIGHEIVTWDPGTSAQPDPPRNEAGTAHAYELTIENGVQKYKGPSRLWIGGTWYDIVSLAAPAEDTRTWTILTHTATGTQGGFRFRTWTGSDAEAITATSETAGDYSYREGFKGALYDGSPQHANDPTSTVTGFDASTEYQSADIGTGTDETFQGIVDGFVVVPASTTSLTFADDTSFGDASAFWFRHVDGAVFKQGWDHQDEAGGSDDPSVTFNLTDEFGNSCATYCVNGVDSYIVEIVHYMHNRESAGAWRLLLGLNGAAPSAIASTVAYYPLTVDTPASETSALPSGSVPELSDCQTASNDTDSQTLP